MKLSGFLLWVGASVLIAAVARAIFRLSWFQRSTKKVKDIKIYTVIGLSVLFAVSYVYVNEAPGIFGLFGAKLFPVEDAIFSGFIISLGADGTYQVWATIKNYKDLMASNLKKLKELEEAPSK